MRTLDLCLSRQARGCLSKETVQTPCIDSPLLHLVSRMCSGAFPQMHNNQGYAKVLATPSMSSWSSPLPHLHSPDCEGWYCWSVQWEFHWEERNSTPGTGKHLWSASSCLCGWWQVCFLSGSWVRIRGTGAEPWGWSLDSAGSCFQWGASDSFPPLPLQILGKCFSACEIKIRQNMALGTEKMH